MWHLDTNSWRDRLEKQERAEATARSLGVDVSEVLGEDDDEDDEDDEAPAAAAIAEGDEDDVEGEDDSNKVAMIDVSSKTKKKKKKKKKKSKLAELQHGVSSRADRILLAEQAEEEERANKPHLQASAAVFCEFFFFFGARRSYNGRHVARGQAV